MRTAQNPRNRPSVPGILAYSTPHVSYACNVGMAKNGSERVREEGEDGGDSRVKGPGSRQYWNPILVPSGPPPAVMMIPRMIKPTIVRTLIDANQNSHSPYTPAPRKLMTTTTTRQTVIQTPLLMVWFQRLMSTAAADNSAGMIMIQLYYYISLDLSL